MKNKINFTATLFAACLTFSSFAYAEGDNDGDRTAKFSEHKAEIVTSIAAEKAVLDQMSSCVNSAQDKDGLEKCRDNKRAAMDNIRSQHLQKRKSHLQDQIKKIEEKETKSKR